MCVCALSCLQPETLEAGGAYDRVGHCHGIGPGQVLWDIECMTDHSKSHLLGDSADGFLQLVSFPVSCFVELD